MSSFTAVGMGELHFSARKNLACYALGSCVACAFYARHQKLGAIAHVVLPGPSPATNAQPHRYATNAVDALVEGMQEREIDPRECEIFLVGGAQVLHLAPLLINGQHIGQRNVQAVKEQLHKHGMSHYREDVGGSEGRTMRLDLHCGRVSVCRAGKEEVVL